MKSSLSMEETLHLLQEENKKFSSHWLWEKLGCEPELFFEAFARHLSKLRIPRDKWEAALDHARAEARIRFQEKQTHHNFSSTPPWPGIQV